MTTPACTARFETPPRISYVEAGQRGVASGSVALYWKGRDTTTCVYVHEHPGCSLNCRRTPEAVRIGVAKGSESGTKTVYWWMRGSFCDEEPCTCPDSWMDRPRPTAKLSRKNRRALRCVPSWHDLDDTDSDKPNRVRTCCDLKGVLGMITVINYYYVFTSHIPI